MRTPIGYANREHFEMFGHGSISRHPNEYLNMPLFTEAHTGRRLYLDLDGVMADFDQHFYNLFGAAPGAKPDDEMWALINSHETYFRTMPIFEDAVDFFKTIELYAPTILTACPRSNYANVAKQKREWVREHLGDHVTVLPVIGGYNKPLFMHAPGDILIDDFKKNTDAWVKAGGVAILHRTFEDSLNELSLRVIEAQAA